MTTLREIHRRACLHDAVGLKTGGVTGAVVDFAAGPLVESLASSATPKLLNARLMAKLAQAILKGDVGSVNSLTAQLAKAAPTASAAVNQATSLSGSRMQPAPRS